MSEALSRWSEAFKVSEMFAALVSEALSRWSEAFKASEMLAALVIRNF